MRVDNSVILFIFLLPSWWWLFITKPQNDFRSKVQKHIASFLCWNNFLAPNGAAPACGATSANQNVDHVCTPGNALSTWPETQSIHSANPQTSTLGSILTSWFLLTPNKVDYVIPANQVFSTFLFLVLYSLSYKSFLPSIPLYSSPNGDCSRHEVLRFVSIT